MKNKNLPFVQLQANLMFYHCISMWIVKHKHHGGLNAVFACVSISQPRYILHLAFSCQRLKKLLVHCMEEKTLYTLV